MAMRDVLSMTYVTDFVDAVKVIRGSPPPSAAVNLCRLGRVVFVDIKGRELGRYGSTQLITVVVPSLLRGYAFDCGKELNQAELNALAALFMDQKLAKCFWDCRADADALNILLRSACPFFRICNLVDVSAAVIASKHFDDDDVCAHMDSIEKAFEDHATTLSGRSADIRMAFEFDQTASTGEASLELGLRGFKARMHGRLNPSRDIWTARPFTIEVVMYSAVNPLMSLVVFLRLQDMWLRGGEASYSHRMAAVVRGSEFLRDMHAVHQWPYATDARVPAGLQEAICGPTTSSGQAGAPWCGLFLGGPHEVYTADEHRCVALMAPDDKENCGAAYHANSWSYSYLD